MSYTTTAYNKRKNIIFVTGNAVSEYKVVAENIARNFSKSVLIDEPDIVYEDYPSLREVGARKSIYFSQLLFYGSLPSRKNVVICTPNLMLRTILQVLFLFEKIQKNVFVVVDDRCVLTGIGKKRFDSLLRNLPPPSRFQVSHYIQMSNSNSPDIITRICQQIDHNARYATTTTLCNYNSILSRIPTVFQEEIKKAVFGNEFSDIPFEKLTQCLLPLFNDSEEEEKKEEEEKEEEEDMIIEPEKITQADIEKLKIPPKVKKTIPDYFGKEKEEEEENISPLKKNNDEVPSLNIIEPEGEFLSLFDFVDENQNSFPPTQLK